ncbi:MAG TPA: hypothetical protein VK177_04500 [Flavobacteriales bacterium]|nr:hypothetical protein [Flavobacteriales bacterium]
MKTARIYVDFNEMVEDDLVLLAKDNFTIDSQGNRVELREGLKVDIYMDDIDDNDNPDNLIASGIVLPNNTDIPWTKNALWLCRIDKDGIRHESDVQ